MLEQCSYGALIITLTVVIHAVTQEQLIQFLERFAPVLSKIFGRYWKILVTITAVMGILLALIAEMWLWAILYLKSGDPAVNTLESALYFSASTFTTLGFGDVILSPDWRLLGSFEATNGLLLFGWSTAFLFEIIFNVYRNDRISAHSKNNLDKASN